MVNLFHHLSRANAFKQMHKQVAEKWESRSAFFEPGNPDQSPLEAF